jgi:hypothetical protein
MAADAKKANAIPWYIKKAEPATPSCTKKTHSSLPLSFASAFIARRTRKASQRAFQPHKLGAALLKYARAQPGTTTKLLERWLH